MTGDINIPLMDNMGREGIMLNSKKAGLLPAQYSGLLWSYVTCSYIFCNYFFTIMLVYWESMVCSIVANGVVYVKYKNAYKTKLMVLNCRLKFCAAIFARVFLNVCCLWFTYIKVTIFAYMFSALNRCEHDINIM